MFIYTYTPDKSDIATVITVTSHFEGYINPEAQQMCLLSYIAYLNHSSPCYQKVSS